MSSVVTYLAVASGGALGSVGRFWLTGLMADLTGLRFPWGTLLINVLGSFAIGVVAGMTIDPHRILMHPDLRIFLMAGVCGGFTTFSAFSLQTLELLAIGEVVPALLYILGSVGLCLALTWAGWALAQPS